jgi:hypothetical protein
LRQLSVEVNRANGVLHFLTVEMEKNSFVTQI